MNQDHKLPVCLVFRKENPELRSIEKVFSILLPYLELKFRIQRYFMPFYSSSVSRMFANIKSARSIGAEVCHVTGDVHYAVLGLSRNKTILTIHDNVFMEKSHGLKRFFFKWVFMKLPVKRATIVTTVSEKTKAEIIKYTGCRTDKIIVIPNPVEPFVYFRKQAFNDVCPRILFIGSTPNKNLERVVTALKGLRCLFQIVGTPSEQQVVLLQLNEIQYKIFQAISDQQLADLYADSDIVLYPSTYEGFGLPIIEAQKAGRVIITSDISPLRETSGGAACLVDPYDVNAIRTGVLRVIKESGYRERLIEKGFDNVSQYVPEKIAEQYLKLYQTLQST